MGSMSQNTGTRPFRTMAWVVDTKVKGVVITKKAVLGEEAPRLVPEGEEKAAEAVAAPKPKKPRKKAVKTSESAS